MIELSAQLREMVPSRKKTAMVAGRKTKMNS